MWDVSDVGRDIQEHLGIVGSSISRRIRGRSMYIIPRGDDEMSRLISRTSTSAPSQSFYQSEGEESYGSVNSSQHNSVPDGIPKIHTNIL